jgi:hypothetical protein
MAGRIIHVSILLYYNNRIRRMDMFGGMKCAVNTRCTDEVK